MKVLAVLRLPGHCVHDRQDREFKNALHGTWYHRDWVVTLWCCEDKVLQVSTLSQISTDFCNYIHSMFHSVTHDAILCVSQLFCILLKLYYFIIYQFLPCGIIYHCYLGIFQLKPSFLTGPQTSSTRAVSGSVSHVQHSDRASIIPSH